MSDFLSNMTAASSLASPSPSESIEQIDDRIDVRQKILLLRQKKKDQLSASISLSPHDSHNANADRLTWFGLDDQEQLPALPSLSRSGAHASSRASDEEEDDDDDADSTVLGHYVHTLPLPPSTFLSRTTRSQHRRPKRISRHSFASEGACTSSHESSSQISCLLDDDTDAHSLHTTTATESSSGPPSRRGSSARASFASRPRSRAASHKDLTLGNAPSSTTSKPLGPPPSAPLPPRPLTSPRSTRSPSVRKGEWSSRRSSRVSTATATSSRSSTSLRSSWQSNNPSLSSSHLIPSPSERSDISDEELDGIRTIAKHFPSPTATATATVMSLPPPVSRLLNRNGSHPSSKSAFNSTHRGFHSRRSRPTTNRTLSPVLDSPMDRHFDTPHQRASHNSAVKGEDSSDSALSDVLDLTDNKGILMLGKSFQQTTLQSGAGVAQVGLGARGFSLSRFRSEQSLRDRSHEHKQQLEAQTQAATSASPGSDRLEIMRDAQNEAQSKSNPRSQPQRRHHQRSSTMTKSMSELVAALDLEASEWGQRLGESDSMEFTNKHVDTAQLRESQLLDARPPASRIGPDASNESSQPALPESDSMPALSASGSQEHSLDDSRGPITADSSLIRSDSAKSLPSQCHHSDTATDVGAGAEFRSIYDAYRHSSSTMASRFTAPVVRIEDPEGDEVDDSELEEVSPSDDMPRKRNKSTRKNHLGFEEQRAAMRSRPSVSHRANSSRPSQTFKSTLNPTQEEDMAASAPSAPPSVAAAAPATTTESTDPYAFYEFSPSLPPFMPTGLSPRDLTGRGTWSSIVARASESMRSRQPSIASLASVSTSATGPVSVRQIRATARAKQKQVEAAHRAREQMSDEFAAMSYRPFAIHDHALSFANHAGMSADLRASVSTMLGASSPVQGMASGRSSSMSNLGYADSVAPSVGDYGTRWPVAVGADQGVGPDDAASMFTMTPWSLSRRPTVQQAKPKVYVEFAMQTSPQPSPTDSKFPITDSLALDWDCRVNRADAKVGRDVRPASDYEPTPNSTSRMDLLGFDVPLRRRRSVASLLSVHDLDSELDQPGLWPSRIRAPRLSSMSRRQSYGDGVFATAVDKTVHASDGGSDEESDLDVNADLQDLAERSGVLDESRGYKRKLHSASTNILEGSFGNDAARRLIASIPARSRRISAALDRIRAQRISRHVGCGSSDDEDDQRDAPTVLSTSRRTTASGRPSLPSSAPTKVERSDNTLRRSKSMAAMGTVKVSGSAGSASPSMLRVRSPSPDISILTNPSDDEEVLLTAEVEPDSAELSHTTVLDEEFDMMVGQTITSRFSNPPHRPVKPAMRRASSETDATLIRPASQTNTSDNGSGSSAEDGNESFPEASKDSQHTLQTRTRSRTSSMGSVIEIIQEADKLLSSTGHSIGHSSGHNTNISDSGGTSGHDPQKPNQVLAEIIRRRMSMRLRGLQTPVALARTQSLQSELSGVKDTSATDQSKVDQVADDVQSPDMQDTPDTMAGSEIWSSFHADRSSTASTATTWSYRSTDETLLRVRTISSTEASQGNKKVATSCADAEPPAFVEDVVDANKQGECAESPTSIASSKAAGGASGASPAIAVLHRKSGGLPVARATLQYKPSRPSLPLPAKSETLASTTASAQPSCSAIPTPKPAMRRYQSVASLEARLSDAVMDSTDLPSPNVVLPKRDVSAVQSAARTARYSDGHRATTPSKAISSVGGGVTPSKLPSLRNAASTTSLRARATADQTVAASPIRTATSNASGIPQRRLPTPRTKVHSRLPPPSGVAVHKI
ncbi:uncharacterized protein UDID_06470 [Ustilago sp. UG-2017a]|nr:uncharacterized protein UDID_06470 [Ustilago sp. UG-2017a]